MTQKQARWSPLFILELWYYHDKMQLVRKFAHLEGKMGKQN